MNSCQKATYLISKKEEGKLTAGESLMLSVHLRVCDLCRSFEKQTGLFSGITKHVNHPTLSDEKKTQLKKMMKDNMSD